MNTSITRPDYRIRFDPEAARHAGHQDAVALLVERHLNDDPAGLLYTALVEIIALAHDDRFEEWSNRLAGFCDVIGPVLQRTQALEAKCALLSASLNQADCLAKITADEQRAIHAAIATCSQVSAGRIIAAHPNDDDTIVTLCELQMAVRALEPKFTETEGGEL